MQEIKILEASLLSVADPELGGREGVNCHKEGRTLVRGTKWRAGVGQGGGFPLSPSGRKWKSGNA